MMMNKSKKLRSVLCLALVLFCLSFTAAATGCHSDIVILPSPVLSLDQDTGTLSWTRIQGAQGYLVVAFTDSYDIDYYIDGADNTEVKISYAFPSLAKGDYLIKVKAVGYVPDSYDSYYSGNQYYEKT